MQRLTVYVSGKIQKTGYRARVLAIARDFGLKGYVQNLDDGRVKVVAEGEAGDLESHASWPAWRAASQSWMARHTGGEREVQPGHHPMTLLAGCRALLLAARKDRQAEDCMEIS